LEHWQDPQLSSFIPYPNGDPGYPSTTLVHSTHLCTQHTCALSKVCCLLVLDSVTSTQTLVQSLHLRTPHTYALHTFVHSALVHSALVRFALVHSALVHSTVVHSALAPTVTCLCSSVLHSTYARMHPVAPAQLRSSALHAPSRRNLHRRNKLGKLVPTTVCLQRIRSAPV
jgi:hypothetical protein